MGRHEQREQVFMLLFRVGFYAPEDMPAQVKLFLENSETELQEKDAAYIEAKEEAVREKLTQIDRIIDEDTKRMGKVELTVLRLAVYEILFDDDIPAGVAINEAVEIAKKFGQENSGGFVNAILAKIAKQGD